MAEYISREDAIAILCGNCFFYGCDETHHCQERRMLEKLPAADVVPVKHGRWLEMDDGITPYCSECQMSHRCFKINPPYCPNCGARMDGDCDD